MSNYIKPQLDFYDTFSDFDKEKEPSYFYYYGSKHAFGDVFLKNRVFVLAEPGYGKTRMLKEVVIRSSIHHKESIYIDLKKIKKPIEVFVNENLDAYVNVNSMISEEEIVGSQHIKTEKFALTNSENVTVCFDALDEIQLGENFSNVIHELQVFINKFHSHPTGNQMRGFF